MRIIVYELTPSLFPQVHFAQETVCPVVAMEGAVFILE
jgi:hypothetical protein